MTKILSKTKKNYALFLFILTLTAIFIYLFKRIFYVFTAALTWFDFFLAFGLLFAESFIIIHSIGYCLNVFRVVKTNSSFNPIIPEPDLNFYPPVAIVVASYKEPLDVLEDTLTCFYNLSYPNKHLYFLDDTRYELPWDTEENKLKYKKSIEKLCQSLQINLFRANWHGAKAGMINDFLQFLTGNIRKDFKFFPFGKKKEKEPEKYIIVFDADMNPFPDFVEYLVSIMEKKPKVAFTQTPQYYTNFALNRVAKASGLQQAIFYEYICEGKDKQGAMFCCGTNVIFRREALEDVGGFDEESVTEDFATSLKFHKRGWESVYLNRVCAFGMGPEDLGAYFKQQFRWARGTLGILRTLPKEFFFNFKKFTLGQWWEYFLASTHYLIGFVFLCLIIYPIMYILFNVPTYLGNPILYGLVFLPYIGLSTWTYLWTLKQRKYPFKDVMQIFLINAITFPVFIKAATYSFLNLKTPFGITPKSGYNSLSLKDLLPQLLMGLLCVFAIGWGLMRMYYEPENFYGILLNVFWTFYNFSMISSFLYFNHPEAKSS